MTGSLGILQQGLFLAFFISLAAAVASLVLYPRMRGRLQSLDPDIQSFLALLWCTLPMVSAFASVFLAILPSLLHVLGFGTDHCVGHPGSHPHFCLVHRPAPSESLLVTVPAALFAMMLAVMALHVIVDTWETLRFKKRLLQFLQYRQGGTNIIQSKTPLALSCGLLRQEIYLSTGLVANLTEAELELVIAHERAHIDRRDAWKALLARTLSLAHFPSLRKRLLSQLSLSSELACDLSSTRVSGDPGKVAELLLKVERLYRQHFSPGASLSVGMLGDGASTIPHRINNLLGERHHRPNRKWIFVLLSFFLLSLVLGHHAIHDFLEHVIALGLE